VVSEEDAIAAECEPFDRAGDWRAEHPDERGGTSRLVESVEAILRRATAQPAIARGGVQRAGRGVDRETCDVDRRPSERYRAYGLQHRSIGRIEPKEGAPLIAPGRTP